MSDPVGGGAGGYPAGWYPLPDGIRERYWDGTRWTDSVRPIAPVGGAVPPPPAYPPSGAPGGYAASPAQAPNHGPAIASMVLGIVSLGFPCAGFATSIIGLILGIASLPHVQPRGPKRGRGMAIAGIVCSALALMVWGVMLLLVIGSN